MGWGGYFKDSGHVYHFFGNSGGGNLSIADVDYKTFENLSDCYARDKNYIYDLRFGKIEEIDAKTFVLIDAEKCIGRDKNGYYNGNDLLTEERLKDDPETRAIINKDKKRNHKKVKKLSRSVTQKNETTYFSHNRICTHKLRGHTSPKQLYSPMRLP
jgi:hypothetical protein